MTAAAAAQSPVLETTRLALRHLGFDDAAFIVTLLNDPAWLEHIGDRKVRTVADARGYLEKGPVAMYAREGFGPYLVLRKADGAKLGICGLIKREGLDDADLGFAFLPAFRSQGYALESSAAIMAMALPAHGMKRVVAITSRANRDSIRLLERIGFTFERMVRLPKDDEEIMLFGFETARGGTMKLTQFHDRLVGNWTGTKKLWMSPPPDPPAVCAAALAVTRVAGGTFLALAYAWSFEGKPQEGLIVIGNENDAGTATASFVDSFHMSGSILQCAGTVDAKGVASVLGHYAAPTGPDWGWRIDVSSTGPAGLRIAMFNIAPDNTVYPAVQADFTRAR